MHARTPVPAGQREEGFSLIELLVAISLIGIIMSGLAFSITNSLSITRDSRERTIAANLASAEIDLAHAVPANNLQEGTLQRVERVGSTNFTIVRESRWENGVTDAQACTALANSASGRGRRFLQVNATVTWEGLRLRQPVRASTAITPSVASYRAGFGHAAITVTDRDGLAVPAITVTLTGNGVTRIVTTTAIGCAFFSDVPAPGTYTVSVNQTGYVDADPDDRAQLGSEIVAIGDRETTRAAFTYDRRSSLNLMLSSPDGGNALDGVPVVARANAATAFFRFSGYGTGGAAGRTIGATPDEGLFPYSGGWEAWAGCEHNDPQDYGAVRLGLNPGPGQVAPSGAPGSVVAGTLRIRIERPDATRSNQILYVTDQLAPAGSPCAGRIQVGQFSAAGTLSRDVILPFGDWRVYVGLSAGYLDVDASLVTPPGLIRVRPGVVATYVQRFTYLYLVGQAVPWLYYRLDETPSYSALDSSGFNSHGGYQSGVVRGAAGALTGEPANLAVTLDGTNGSYVTTPAAADDPDVLSFEIWFKTALTTRGGRIVGFGSSQTGASTNTDRHLYMRTDGRLVFGVNDNRTVTTTGRYDNNAWHHAVVTLGSGGTALYVDGALAASSNASANFREGRDYTGYARVGYDSLTGWPSPPALAFLGQVDEFAAYQTVLPLARVSAHYAARTTANYAATVGADDPVYYYRFNEAAAPALDSSGNARHGTHQGGVTAPGALLTDTNPAVALGPTAYVASPVQVSSPTAFTLEAWFKTTSVRGGRIVGFGSASTGTSAASTFDRHLYLNNAGQIVFGVNRTSRFTITSPLAYRDDQWHHVVATYQASGMALYVDGVLTPVATRAATASGTAYNGYWRVGADNLASWSGVPSDAGLSGSVDEVAVYHTVLTAQQAQDHYLSARP